MSGEPVSARKSLRPLAISLRFPVIAFDTRPRVTGTVVRSQESGFAVMFDHPIEERIYRKDPLQV